MKIELFVFYLQTFCLLVISFTGIMLHRPFIILVTIPVLILNYVWNKELLDEEFKKK